MTMPKGPMLVFNLAGGAGVWGMKTFNLHTWVGRRSPVGMRVLDVAGHLWVVESWEKLGRVWPGSFFDFLFHGFGWRVKLNLVDKGEISLADARALIDEFCALKNIREGWSEIGLDDAPAVAARAPNVSKLVMRFYGPLKLRT